MESLFGQFTRGLFIFHHGKFQARIRHAVQAQHFDRHGWPGFFEALAFLVDESADASVKLAAQDDIADMESAFTDENSGGRAAGFDARFDDIAFGAAIRIGLQLEQICL